MRRQSVLPLIGVIIFVIYFLHLLSVVLVPVLRTILLDIRPHALSKEELAVPSSQPHNDGATTIPKIIHQIYLGFDNKEMPPGWEQARQSCIDLHHTYEYRVGRTSGRSLEGLVLKHFLAMDKRLGSRSA
jgi:mannosyltransferase OCH1-like enzyme